MPRRGALTRRLSRSPSLATAFAQWELIRLARRGKGAGAAVIYLDVLLCVNLIVNYFLILASRFFTGDVMRRGRFALGALAGSLFSLTVALPPLGALVSAAIKLAGCCVMTLAAFGFCNIRRFALRAAYLSLSSALFAGAVYALRETAAGGVLAARNLSVYAAIDPLTLVAFVVGIYLVLCVAELLWGAPKKLAKRYPARITAGSRSVSFDAMLDTGNKLRDPLTGRGAVVLRRSLASGILTPAQLAALEEYERGCVATQRLRECGSAVLLPFSTISEKGLMLAFLADGCELLCGSTRRRMSDILVAFAGVELPSGCDGVVSADIIQEVYHVGKKDCGGAARAHNKARSRR